MDQKLFRQESLDRASSPDQLNQYIRVGNPSVWLVLSAVIVLFIAVGIWGSVGRLETIFSVKAIAKEGKIFCLLDEEQRTWVEAGMVLRIGDATGEIFKVSSAPNSYNELQAEFGEYTLYACGISEGEWRYSVQGTLPQAEGVYEAEIVVDSVSPLSFLVN